MYGRELERVGSFKFLGVTFDSRLTFAEQIKKIEDKCKKVINVMRCLTGREWGASRSSLKRVYVALIRSVLDYGSIVVGSAAKSLLKRLEVIQTQALRICCGAFKTSSVPAYTSGNGRNATGIKEDSTDGKLLGRTAGT